MLSTIGDGQLSRTLKNERGRRDKGDDDMYMDRIISLESLSDMRKVSLYPGCSK